MSRRVSSAAARLYVDEDLPKALAQLLRGARHDAVFTREVGNDGRADADQFGFAIQEDRILLTSNLDDFRLLHEAWLAWIVRWGEDKGQSHPGIIVLPNANSMPEATMAQLIDDLLQHNPPASLRNRLLRYRLAIGWEDLSPVRGRRGRP